MGLYGSSIYGISTYGDSSRPLIYNIGFTADTVNYRTVNLSWNAIDVVSNETVYSWKIIKTVGGAPDYPNQGQLVTYFVDQDPSAGKKISDGTKTDNDSIFPSNSIITYSFWVLISSTGDKLQANWKLLGAADAVIVDANSEDTTLRILRMLPGAWTSKAAEALGEPDTDTDLYNFVGAFGFYYDKLRAEAGALNSLSDYRKFPKELLPAAITALGFTYEPKLGDSFHRSLYKNGHLINSLKGSYIGINNYVKALTHFKPMISVGRNMMLDYLQSSFEGSVGTWATTGATSFSSESRASTSVTSPTLSFSQSYLSDGYGVLTKSTISISSLTTDGSLSGTTPVAGTTWTVTTSTAHGVGAGDSVTITNVHPTQFNNTFTVASVISSTKFTITNTTTEYASVTIAHLSGEAFATVTWGGSVPTAHGLVTGDQVTLSGASTAVVNESGGFTNFNTTFSITKLTANTFKITIPATTVFLSNLPAGGKAIIKTSTASPIASFTSTSAPTMLSYGSSSVTDTTTKTFLVTPGMPYLFSGWALIKSGSTTGITVQAQIQWFDENGASLDSATAGSTVNPNGAWKKFESSSSYSAIFAPTKARYAGVKIMTTNMVTGDSLYLDNFMFSVYPGLLGNREFGSGDFIYEDAKDIVINLEGYRTNLVRNPGFEDGVGFWNSTNGTLISVTSPITPLMAGSTKVCKFTSTTGASSAIYTNWIRNLKPSKEYTFSAYVLGPANGITATANIEWDMPQSIDDQTKVVTSTTVGAKDKYRPTINKKISSSSTLLNSSSWTRISVTATAPDFNTFNGFPSAMVSIEFTATAGSEVWYLDCALFEESATVNTYFQGNGGIIPEITIPAGSTIPSIITDDLIPVEDTAWETKARTNFVYNPTFDNSTTYYTASSTGTSSSATLSDITGETVSSLTFAPKFTSTNGKFGKILTNSSTTSSTLVTSFKYPSLTTSATSIPNMPTGGEVFSASAYVTSAVSGTYTITFTDVTQGKSYSNSFPVTTASATWTRINVTGYVEKPITSYPRGSVSITFTPTTSPAAVAWYVDGVQAEYGSLPTTFVDPFNSKTVTSLNKSEVLLGTATTTSNISAAVKDSPATGYVTYTTASAHIISPGDTVTISGVTVPGTQTISSIFRSSTPTVSTDWDNTLTSISSTTYKTGLLLQTATNASLSIQTYTPTSSPFYAMADQTLSSFPTTTTAIQFFSTATSAGEIALTPPNASTTMAVASVSGSGSSQTYTYSAIGQYFAVGQTISVTGYTTLTGYNVTNATVTAVATITSGSSYSVSVAGSTTGTPVGTGSIQTSTAGSSQTFLNVTAGRTYYSEIKGLTTGPSRVITLKINWLDASGSVISTTSGTGVTIPASIYVTKSATSSSGNTITVTSSTSLVAGTSTNPGSTLVVPGANYLPGGNTITAISGAGPYTLTMQYPVTTASSTTQSITFSNPIKPTVQGVAPSGAVKAYISIAGNAAGNNNLHLNNFKFLDVTTANITVGSTSNYSVGQSVVLSGITTPTGYNSTFTITGINSSTNTFTIDNDNATGSVTGTPIVTIPNNFNGTFVAAVGNITSYKFAVPATVNYTTPIVTGATAAVTNATTNKNSYAIKSIMENIGRSYYWPNISVKYSRLLNNIVNYLPFGSTYTINKGVPSEPKNESISSLVPSYSFENSLYGWSGLANNTISRYVSAGSQGSVQGVNSASWLVATNIIDTNAIGASAEFHVTPSTLYQFSANLQAPTANIGLTSRKGATQLDVSWYTDSTKTTQIGSTANIHTGDSDSANAENRWAFLSGRYASPKNAFYAVLKVSYLPTSGYTSADSSNCVYIDDVVCSPL